ncbi:Hypothetical_protein [Hexamita inflata]|uniref:Hypothetical_protein n=1 Tax=Hexamita inflata TaxID=28002 RepID=A0ABP1GPG7_9EUKA
MKQSQQNLVRREMDPGSEQPLIIEDLQHEKISKQLTNVFTQYLFIGTTVIVQTNDFGCQFVVRLIQVKSLVQNSDINLSCYKSRIFTTVFQLQYYNAVSSYLAQLLFVIYFPILLISVEIKICYLNNKIAKLQ